MVRVYESPIDFMSDMTMRRFITGNCVALCCLGDNALATYLKENPHLRRLDLCLDNDQWGRKAAERMKEKYEKSGYEIHDFTPPKGCLVYTAHTAYSSQRRKTLCPHARRAEKHF